MPTSPEYLHSELHTVELFQKPGYGYYEGEPEGKNKAFIPIRYSFSILKSNRRN